MSLFKDSRSESPYMFSEITMKKLHVNIEYDVLTEIGRYFSRVVTLLLTVLSFLFIS